jgi:hypothetical protein
MKYVFFLILIITKTLHAEELLLYPRYPLLKSLETYLLEHKISYSPVFTSVEKKFLKLSYQSQNSIKVSIDKFELESFYKNKTIQDLTHKIEINHQLKFYEEPYEKWQWGLKNTGSDIEIKISDIDSTYIKAKTNEDINLPSEVENTNRKIRIAVIDSGIDLTHPDLKNKIYSSESECKKLAEYEKCLIEQSNVEICHKEYAQLDTDQNGYPLDCHGWNVAAPINETTKIQGNNNVQDLIGHGTFVSGIIAADNKNQEGIRGIIDNVEILPVKVSGSDEEVEEDNATDIFAKGILYALQTGVDIINLSVGWASDEDSLLVTEIIQKAHEMGVLVVVAAGNSGHSSVTYPCTYNEVICVGAHNPDGEIAQFSNRGASIDIMAPGRKILSTWPLELHPKLFTNRNGYEYKDGTSFSAPFVVGALARLINLGFSPIEAKIKLLSSTRVKKESTPNVLNGNLDLQNAIKINPKSFIYPFKKSPALINWGSQKKKILIKLKNYYQSTSDIKIQLTARDMSIVVKNRKLEFDSWNPDEIKEIEFYIDGPDNINSDLVFDLKIHSQDEEKSYPIQAVALTIISEEFRRVDTIQRKLESHVPIQNMTILPFENISPYNFQDFLVVDTSEKKVKLQLMKLVGDNYRISPSVTTDLEKPYISHLARIDLDQNGSIEYVVMGFLKIKGTVEDTWKTKFYVYDSKFKPLEFLIAPQNEFDNKLTTISDKIFWLKINNSIVPTWISQGFTPKEDLTPLNPWRAPILNDYKKHIYYFTPERLHILNLGDSLNPIEPHSFFEQNSEERLNFRAKFLYYSSGVYKKDYFVQDISSQVPLFKFESDFFHDVAELNFEKTLNPQEIVFSDNDGIFRTRVSLFNHQKSKLDQYIFESNDLFDPIQTIFAKDENTTFFGLSKYRLLFISNNQILSTESRNTDYNIQYTPLKNQTALYLPSQHTPAFSSEVISFNEESQQIERNSKYRTSPYGSCQEIGLGSSFWSKSDEIIYYCDQNKTFHFITL